MHPYFKNPYQLRVFLNISPKDQMENIKKQQWPGKGKTISEYVDPKGGSLF